MTQPLSSSSYLALDWPLPSGVQACITTREGGISQGPFAGLNLGGHVGDAPDAVAHNRAYLGTQIQYPVQWQRQVHGTEVVTLPQTEPCDADAVYTATSGQVCAVLTADCLPVLLASRHGDEVAAVHCGWRGLAAGILPKVSAHFRAEGANITAFLGPAISQTYFEVGDDVLASFLAAQEGGRFGGRVEQCFVAGEAAGKYYANLYELARAELNALGVSDVRGGDYCTYADPRFFSYRRDQQTGRMASLIWINP